MIPPAGAPRGQREPSLLPAHAAVLLVVAALLLPGGCGEPDRSARVGETGSTGAGDAGGGGSPGFLPDDPGFLPDDDFLGVWKKKGPPRFYDSVNLYGYINGGAEVFFELGFERLDMQHYERGEDAIGVEVYTMTDAAAALGIYLMKCGRETPDSIFDERHTTNRFHLLFRKGRAYVLIANLEETEGGAEALLPFARHVAVGLPGGEEEEYFAILPEEGRIAGSERVIRGQFTLQRVYSLGEGDILRLEKNNASSGPVTAVAADYRTDEEGAVTRVAADYPDKAAADAALDSVKTNLDRYIEPLSSDDTSLTFRDYAGRKGLVKVAGRRLEITVNMNEE
jgi:hypothetical protein